MRRHAFWRSRIGRPTTFYEIQTEAIQTKPELICLVVEKNGLKTLFHADETLTKLYSIVSDYLHMCHFIIEIAAQVDKFGIFMSIIHLKKSLTSQLYLVSHSIVTPSVTG